MFEEVLGTSSVLQNVFGAGRRKLRPQIKCFDRGRRRGPERSDRAGRFTKIETRRAFVRWSECAANSLVVDHVGIVRTRKEHSRERCNGGSAFELAEGGTLFLDEVGDLPLETPNRAAARSQEHEFERVGGTEMLRCDVGVISATIAICVRYPDWFVSQRSFLSTQRFPN